LQGRRFTTLRRAYFHGDTLVREESVSRQRANKVQVGSIDERLLSEVCSAYAGVEEPGFVESVGRALQGVLDPERPTAMHADMRTLADGSRGRIAPVSDSTVKPVTPVAPPTAAPTPSGEKPRHILLPPIDKAAADQAGGRRRGEVRNARRGTRGSVQAGSEAGPQGSRERRFQCGVVAAGIRQ
jgi:hypothetical protein